MVRKRVEKTNKRPVSKDNDLWKRLQGTPDKVGRTTGRGNCTENRSNKQKEKRPRKALHSMRRPLLSELLSMQEMSGACTKGRLGLRIAKELSDRMIVYIMGPYSSDPEFHTDYAMAIANVVLGRGGVPFIPHLTHYWDKKIPRPWMFWIAYDLYLADNFKKKNLCAVRIPGPSNGADIEERFFVEKGVRVYQLRDIMNPNFNFPRRKAYGR